MIAMGNGLTGKAKLEIVGYKVARKHNHEYGHKAIEQLEIAEHHAVADAANHAKAAPLRQRADYKRYAKRCKERRKFGTGAGFAELEQRRHGDNKNKQAEHERGEDGAFGNAKGVITPEREAALHELHADEYADGEADKGHKRVKIAAAKADDHTQRAAEERKGSYHYERTQHEAGSRGTAALCAELALNERHYERAQHKADYFGAHILHLRRAVQAACSGDVPEEAGYAEAHVGGVAERGEQHGGKTYQRTGYDHDPVYLFHFRDISL